MERFRSLLLKSTSGAVFSTNRKNRYILWRRFQAGNNLLHFIMLNPSEADETSNDPTITRCIQFAKDWHYDGVIVTNLFSYCTPYPNELINRQKNLSAKNKSAIQFAIEFSYKTICAWGNHGKMQNRSRKILNLLDHSKSYCLELNKSGEPKHPLYVRKDNIPIRYQMEKNHE